MLYLLALSKVSLPVTLETVSIFTMLAPAWSILDQGLIQALPNCT